MTVCRGKEDTLPWKELSRVNQREKFVSACLTETNDDRPVSTVRNQSQDWVQLARAIPRDLAAGQWIRFESMTNSSSNDPLIPDTPVRGLSGPSTDSGMGFSARASACPGAGRAALAALADRESATRLR